jgi:hypothetical protein
MLTDFRSYPATLLLSFHELDSSIVVEKTDKVSMLL